MSRVLQALEIFEICTCHIFELFWLPKVISTLSKQPTERDSVFVEDRKYDSSGQ